MNKFFKKVFVSMLVLLTVFSFGMQSAEAAISGGAISGVGASDLIVNTTNADYNVSFDTNIGATATQLWVIFPEGYTIPNGSLGASSVSYADGSNAGFINVGGIPRTIDNVIGDFGSRKITITLTSAYDLGTDAGASFRFTSGIQNPTATGATGTFTC